MRKATYSDRSIILDILTRSFDDNKSVNYVVKQDHNRIGRIRKLMDYSFNVCCEFGEVWLSANQQACALILFPDKKCLSFHTLFWDLKLVLTVIGLDRASKVLKREALIKSNHPKGPIAHLWFLGVHPQHQGKGIGSAFMWKVIKECEEKKRPIHLKTSMEKNLPFYKKLGFEIFRSLQLTYTLYQLRRM